MIKEATRTAAETFRTSIEKYSPARDKNGYNERNISYYCAMQMQNTIQRSLLFHEHPLPGKGKNNWNRRVDTIVICDRNVIFVEYKQIYKKDKADSAAEDFARIDKNMLEAITGEFNAQWEHAYMVIIAELWGDKIRDWWEGSGDARKMDWPKMVSQGDERPISFPVKEMKPGKKGDNLYWGLAYRIIQ